MRWIPGRTSARSSDSYLSAFSNFVQPCQILLIIRCPSFSLPPAYQSTVTLLHCSSNQLSPQEVSHRAADFHQVGVTQEVVGLIRHIVVFSDRFALLSCR